LTPAPARVQAAAGSISQSGSGTITADGLGIRAQNNVSLTLANDINTIAADITGAGNTFSYNDATGISIGQAGEIYVVNLAVIPDAHVLRIDLP
jgi:hypothetical protein